MRFLSALMIATLPLAAGFCISAASAQVAPYDSSTMAPPSYSYPSAAAPVAGGMDRSAQLEQQIRELTNQVEQKDFQIRQLQQSFERYVADTNMRLQSLESRSGGAVVPQPSQSSFETPASDAAVPMPESSSLPTTGSLGDPNGAFQPDAGTYTAPDRQLGQINETPSNDGAVTSGRGQPSANNAAKAYDQAFSYLQQNNYTDATRAFQEFLRTYASHPLAANAQYWLGETYFAQTQYTTAAKTFARAYQDYPNGQKAPDALLKLAQTLDKLEKREDACLTLVELDKRFPSGPASVMRRADEESRRMGCKG